VRTPVLPDQPLQAQGSVDAERDRTRAHLLAARGIGVEHNTRVRRRRLAGDRLAACQLRQLEVAQLDPDIGADQARPPSPAPPPAGRRREAGSCSGTSARQAGRTPAPGLRRVAAITANPSRFGPSRPHARAARQRHAAGSQRRAARSTRPEIPARSPGWAARAARRRARRRGRRVSSRAHRQHDVNLNVAALLECGDPVILARMTAGKRRFFPIAVLLGALTRRRRHPPTRSPCTTPARNRSRRSTARSCGSPASSQGSR